MVNDWPGLANLTQMHTVTISGRHGISRGRRGRKDLRWQEVDESDPRESHVLDLAVLESVSTLSLWNVDHELSNLSRLTALMSLHLGQCSLERLPHMGTHMRLEMLRIWSCKRLRGWDGVGYSEGSSASQTELALHCDWTLPHLKELMWWDSGVVELPDLGYFPQLQELSLHNNGTARCTHGSNYAVRCLANHLHLETLSCVHSQIAELPDLSRFPRLRLLRLHDCDVLTSLTISGPLTALESISLQRCGNLNGIALPSVYFFPRLEEFEIGECGVQLHEQEVEHLRARGFRFNNDWGESSWSLAPALSTTGSVSGSEPDCDAGVQLALEEPDDVAAGPSSREAAPSSSDFVPYDESITECAPRVSKRASSSDTQDLMREEIRCFWGCEIWDMLLCWFMNFFLGGPQSKLGCSTENCKYCVLGSIGHQSGIKK